jgi:uncharacterized protein (TIGR02246 family)
MIVTIQKPVRVFNPEFKGKPEQEIEALEHRLSDAWLQQNTAVLNELHSDDVLIKEVIGNKAQYIALLTAPHLKDTITSIEKVDLRIRIHGDTAIVAGQQMMNIKTRDGASTSTAPFLNVWRKEKDGKWRCIASS